MRTRPWEPDDTGAVQALHETMCMGYALPALDGPLFALKRVLADDAGVVVGAGAVKPVGECFLWVAPTLSPVARARAFRRLAGEARVNAAAAGYDELTAWIPPQIEGEFAPALLRGGWRMSPWRSWSVRL